MVEGAFGSRAMQLLGADLADAAIAPNAEGPPFGDPSKAFPYIARMLSRVRNSRGRPINAPAAFIHP